MAWGETTIGRGGEGCNYEAPILGRPARRFSACTPGVRSYLSAGVLSSSRVGASTHPRPVQPVLRDYLTVRHGSARLAANHKPPSTRSTNRSGADDSSCCTRGYGWTTLR
ncbi:hypothetical protein Bbelb_123110 [Branchiostoma belcheri]|nr:hypothetical protein Bbelb_123110 [Branchiostoma belcheri]